MHTPDTLLPGVTVAAFGRSVMPTRAFVDHVTSWCALFVQVKRAIACTPSRTATFTDPLTASGLTPLTMSVVSAIVIGGIGVGVGVGCSIWMLAVNVPEPIVFVAVSVQTHVPPLDGVPDRRRALAVNVRPGGVSRADPVPRTQESV
ncbi:MAG: hypothetical protein F4X54_07485 [Chloroflexi bacterium]|nr:hypothetical protein [Chloroflexota bacterium]MYB84560.1 hypothetical protein [Chloroflexota bacterium]